MRERHPAQKSLICTNTHAGFLSTMFRCCNSTLGIYGHRCRENVGHWSELLPVCYWCCVARTAGCSGHRSSAVMWRNVSLPVSCVTRPGPVLAAETTGWEKGRHHLCYFYQAKSTNTQTLHFPVCENTPNFSFTFNLITRGCVNAINKNQMTLTHLSCCHRYKQWYANLDIYMTNTAVSQNTSIM